MCLSVVRLAGGVSRPSPWQPGGKWPSRRHRKAPLREALRDASQSRARGEGPAFVARMGARRSCEALNLLTQKALTATRRVKPVAV